MWFLSIFACHATLLPCTAAKPVSQIIMINHPCFHSTGTWGNQRIDSLWRVEPVVWYMLTIHDIYQNAEFLCCLWGFAGLLFLQPYLISDNPEAYAAITNNIIHYYTHSKARAGELVRQESRSRRVTTYAHSRLWCMYDSCNIHSRMTSVIYFRQTYN